MNKGSAWHIWDLHVHTPHSILNNQFGDPSADATWENYVTRLESAALQRGVVAIGLTDYFTIEGYARVLEFQQKGRLQEILLLPNIEFRIDKVVYRDKENGNPKRLNLHVILSPSISPKDIQEHFLDDIEFVYEQDPWQSADKRKLKRSNLTSFGASFQDQHDAFKGKDPFEVGCLNAVVSAEMIKQILDPRFRGDYLMVLAEETLPLMDWDSQHHGIRKQLLQMAHAVFSSNEKTSAFCIGSTHSSPSAFVAEFKSLKPCLWGSDAHAFDERFLSPEQGRFCWIKGDVTWEGLRQVLFEPSQRVAIQELSPEPTKSTYTLSRLSIPATTVRPSLGIATSNLEFNPNLVAIIGGRGSGKTAILDLIASCFSEGDKLKTITTSFFHRLYVQAPPAGEGPSRSIPVSLSLASGEIFQKEVGDETTYLANSDVVYLTQNHFDEYSADPQKLHGHIVDLVFQHFTEERRRLQTLEGSLQDLDRSLAELNLKIEHLSSDVSSRKQAELEELSGLLGKQEDIQHRIAEVEATQGEQADEARAVSEELHNLLARDLAISSALKALTEVRLTAESFLADYSSTAQKANTAIQRAAAGLNMDLFTMIPTELRDMPQLLSTIRLNQDHLSIEAKRTSESLDESRRRIAELEGLDKVLADLREVLSASSISIEDVNTRIVETAHNEAHLEEYSASRRHLFAEQMDLTVQIRQFLQSIIERFRTGSPATLENIMFDAVVSLDQYGEYVRQVALLLDNRVTSEAALSEILSPCYEALRRHIQEEAGLGEFLADSMAIWSALEPLKTKVSVGMAQYSDAAFQRFFQVSIAIVYSGKRMVDLSMGERAIVLLKVLLALGDCPLLIDQPEEHLDNRYVFDDLTPAFREAKAKRQIVIATHNANLVVNTDAEQVMIAENIEGVLSYRLGTLEDLAIRNSITTILEGGDEAFRKRERRYGYVY